ncbi:hypothetical protein N431DRAFT_528001 [Stipitochalara longipes BDJ]|nr:hypothetical protein N431DRAFT_528001 [Stipitochalara longipes BDJ]
MSLPTTHHPSPPALGPTHHHLIILNWSSSFSPQDHLCVCIRNPRLKDGTPHSTSPGSHFGPFPSSASSAQPTEPANEVTSSLKVYDVQYIEHIPIVLGCVVTQPHLARPFSPSGSGDRKRRKDAGHCQTLGAVQETDAYMAITWQTSSAGAEAEAESIFFSCSPNGDLPVAGPPLFPFPRKTAALEPGFDSYVQACNA